MPPITDPARLAILEKGRQTAKENRERKKKEKEEKEKAEKESTVKPEEVPAPPVLKRQDAEVPKDVKQEDPEPQVVVVKQSKKSKKKVIYVDESSSEDEPIVIKRRGRKKKVIYEEELDIPLHGGERKFVNPRNMSKPPQNDLTSNLAKPSDKQQLPPPPPVRPDKPYNFQVSSIMGKYFPN